ncbi:MAG: phosphoglycerate kinase [Patescibacteria group bacterium]|nr:phosphoglycerate kinase [Patescibacteria group bacterium]
MKSIKDIENLNGVRVLLRLDLNVPLENNKIIDDFRIKKVLPTIKYLTEKGAKIIIISHIEKTLKPVAEYLEKIFKVFFIENYRNALTEFEHIKEGEIILLENIRNWKEEKNNDQKFAKEMASLGDIYVNDAFSVCHREHASIIGIPKYLPSYAGLQLEEEIKNLSECFNPSHPFLFIIGGVKFDTKFPLIKKFLNIADYVFIGGALANNFLREKGIDISNSIVSSNNFDLKEYLDSPKLILPIDFERENNAIVDAGPKTLEELQKYISKSKFILWNGPLGAYENGFKKPTIELAKMIADSHAKTIVGGGDTIAAISELGIEDKFSFVSTGGGAMLQYLASGTLPGIEALEN